MKRAAMFRFSDLAEAPEIVYWYLPNNGTTHSQFILMGRPLANTAKNINIVSIEKLQYFQHSVYGQD